MTPRPSKVSRGRTGSNQYTRREQSLAPRAAQATSAADVAWAFDPASAAWNAVGVSGLDAVQRWAAFGYSPVDITNWTREPGDTSYGFTVNEAAAWRDAVHSYPAPWEDAHTAIDEALTWYASGYSAPEATRWLRRGFDCVSVENILDHPGVEPKTVDREWTAAGFDRAARLAWVGAFTPSEAAVWRYTGECVLALLSADGKAWRPKSVIGCMASSAAGRIPADLSVAEIIDDVYAQMT